MRPKHKTWTMAVADDNAICESQKPLAAGNLTINGVLASTATDTGEYPTATRPAAVLDIYRRVAIASDADERTATFTLTGTDPAGAMFTETLTGPNATTVVSLNSFAKVISIHSDKAAAGNLIAGTCNQADTPWMPLSYYGTTFELSLQAKYSTGASLTWQWQSSNSPPQNGTTAASKQATAEGSALTATGVVQVGEFPRLMVRAHISGYVGGSVDYAIVKTTG